jgi:hypothetical protein
VPYCNHCSRSFTGKRCPLCGGPPAHTPAQVDAVVKLDFWLMLGGLAACILISYRYTPLDLNPIMAVCLPLMLIPMTVHIVLAVRKRAAEHLPLLKNLYHYCGAFLVLFAVFLFVNGALDRTTTPEIRSVVLRKSVSHSTKGGVTYYLTVNSWRPGKSTEHLRVNGRTFSSVHEGESVAIQVHSGAFGVPWFGRVTPL